MGKLIELNRVLRAITTNITPQNPELQVKLASLVADVETLTSGTSVFVDLEYVLSKVSDDDLQVSAMVLSDAASISSRRNTTTALSSSVSRKTFCVSFKDEDVDLDMKVVDDFDVGDEAEVFEFSSGGRRATIYDFQEEEKRAPSLSSIRASMTNFEAPDAASDLQDDDDELIAQQLPLRESDVYPFNLPDSDENILYGQEDDESKCIRAATLDKLIEKMTCDAFVDAKSNLRYVFFLTYTSFTTAEEVLMKLALRFNGPVGASGVPNQATIKLKTLGLIQYWIKEFFCDFEERPLLKEYLEDLLTQGLHTADKNYSNLVTGLLELMKKQEQLSLEKKAKAKRPKRVPKVFGVEDDVVKLEKKALNEIDAVQVAEQLTLKDYDLLKKIPIREFLSQGWMKENKSDIVPRIMEAINFHNRVSAWAQSFILSYEDDSKRLQALRKMILVANALKDLNNFSSLAAVFYGIEASAIRRLKCYKKMNKSDLLIMEDIRMLFQDRKSLRVAMESASRPCVPFLGTYLSYLTGMDFNEDKIGDLINFRKRAMMAERIRWIKQAQLNGYESKIAPDPLFETYINNNVKYLKEDELYTISLSRES